jgi:hypothetical protein
VDALTYLRALERYERQLKANESIQSTLDSWLI